MPVLEHYGNIWNWHEEGHLLVIPTNVGFNSSGENIMGAGLAKQAALRFPDLPKLYGDYCQKTKEESQVVLFNHMKLIMFPTKALNTLQPWLSWKNNSTLELIEQSAKQLNQIKLTRQEKEIIVLPLVGCGHGGLRPSDVIPILKRNLTAKGFILSRA